MANDIAKVTKYQPLLDEVYKKASLTSILDTPENKVRFNNAKAIKVFKTSMDGLGNYSRNTGFVDGDVTASWETMELQQDRGRSFSVDSMDDEETINQAFGTLSGEFIRTKVVPEIDAYRFAKYSSWSGVSSASADISSSTDCVALVDTAESVLGDDEVPEDGRILFVSEEFYKGIKANITRTLVNQNGVQRNVETFDGMPVIRVPKNRFNTAITLKTGGAGQTAGGYVPTATTGYGINFMIVHPSAVIQIAKHVKPRVFSPDTNQKADAWKFDYRIYHDAFVEDNKVAGIYVHKRATANS